MAKENNIYRMLTQKKASVKTEKIMASAHMLHA